MQITVTKPFDSPALSYSGSIDLGGYWNVASGSAGYVFVGRGLGSGSFTRSGVSTDGVNWTSGTGLPVTLNHWYDVAFGDGIYTAIGPVDYQGSAYVTSTDGLVWGGYTPIPGKTSMSVIRFASGTFIGLYNLGEAIVFPSQEAFTLPDVIRDIIWDGSKFVICGDRAQNNGIWTSDSLSGSWTKRFDGRFNCLNYNESTNTYVAVGENTIGCAVSHDGITWSTVINIKASAIGSNPDYFFAQTNTPVSGVSSGTFAAIADSYGNSWALYPTVVNPTMYSNIVDSFYDPGTGFWLVFDKTGVHRYRME